MDAERLVHNATAKEIHDDINSQLNKKHSSINKGLLLQFLILAELRELNRYMKTFAEAEDV